VNSTPRQENRDISLRVEVSLFVASPELEDRNAVANFDVNVNFPKMINDRDL
jgi:hypothetical protein